MISSPLQKAWPYLCVLVFVAAALSLYRHLYLGVSLADESFYVALGYRFALGDIPFNDEWFIAQTASLLTYPFINTYVSWFGNSALVLFTRHLYFIFLVAIAGFTAWVFRKRGLSRQDALLAASPLLLYIPYNVPNLGYNTLGAGFFGLGVLIAVSGIRKLAVYYLFALVGILHALAVYAYPPMVAALVVFLAVWMFPREARFQRAVGYITGGLFAAAVIFILVGAGIEDYRHIIELSQIGASSSHVFGWGKIAALSAELMVHWILILGFVIMAFLGPSRVPRRDVLALGWLIVCWWLTRASRGGGGQPAFLIFMTLGSLAIYWRQTLARQVSIPLLAAGGCMAFASNNGLDAAAVALPVSLCLFLFEQRAASGLRPAFVRVTTCLLLTLILFRFHQSVFGESQFSRLEARVEHGPFKYLRTIPEKKKYVEELEEKISEWSGDARKILVYPHLPAGYLMTRLRPSSPAVWETCPLALMERCFEFDASVARRGDLVVRVKRLLHSPESIIENSRHPFDALVAGTRPIWENENFAIYRRN